MASYSVSAGHVGAYNKTLVADTVDTVTFADDLAEVEITTDGAADIFVRFDGTAPTVNGSQCWLVPAGAGTSSFAPKSTGATVVKLISSGAPKYSVSRAD